MVRQYKCHSEDCHLPIPNFQVSDLVWLDARNIHTKCPLKKLDYCHLGPFPIIEKIFLHAVQLGLSLTLWHIHLVFHVSLLQPTNSSTIHKHPSAIGIGRIGGPENPWQSSQSAPKGVWSSLPHWMEGLCKYLWIHKLGTQGKRLECPWSHQGLPRGISC